MEQTMAIAARAAPAEGALDADGSGWLLGVGDPRRRLYPRLCRWVDRSAGLSSLPACALTSLHLPMLATISLSLMPFFLFFGASSLLPWSDVRRQLRRATKSSSLAEVPSGGLVRVTGVIAQQATVDTLFRGIPAVLFRSRVGAADETRGIDFFIDLDDGERVKVTARGALLLERPMRAREPPACGPVSPCNVDGAHVIRSDLLRRPRLLRHRRYEAWVGPGHRVEICGVVDRELAPELPARSPRQAPTRQILRAGDGVHLLVRRQP
jgi:hypothetical protein